MATNGRPLDRWRVPRAELLAELARGQKPKELVCLGCAAKVELVGTVYPVLAKVGAWLRARFPQIRLQPRDDVYTFETDGAIEVERSRYSIKELMAGVNARVTQDFARVRPTGIVVLANFLPFPAQEKMVRVLEVFYEGSAKANAPFTVGKGHTIQIAKRDDEEYLVVDFVKSTGTRRYGVANNDTISTIDPNLEYASWVSLFVAMNNALNDLFTSGVHEGLKIYPTCDARDPKDFATIRDGLRRYGDRFAAMGVEVIEREPLGFSTKSMGATVVGVTDREIPANQRLVSGQWLVATRPVGDLAPLTEMLILQSLDEDASALEDLRVRVLETMLTPNVEAARILAGYLPSKGQPFDPSRHVTSCRDMSGPGILALEELAQDSRKDVYLGGLKLVDERVAKVEMPNPTSGTNGAIIVAAMPEVARRVMRDLDGVGYAPWVMGRVEGEAREAPRVLINEKLARYGFLKGRQRGIFESYDFVPERAIS